jgi:energy-coupling factor transporter ATP-binding protein EcfA2
MTAVRLDDVWFSYATDPVVRGVSLRVLPGESVALLGHNGAGKTTLTKLMVGLLAPSRGTIEVAGVETRGKAPEDLARVAAYVFQHPDQQLFARTVLEEVAFAPRQLGRSAAEIAADAALALREVGLEAHASVHPYDLPLAERKLVTLAAAIAQRPRVLILDEPTQGLDRASRARVSEIIRDMVGKGTAVLAVTHDLTFVAEALDRAIVMSGGAVVLDETARAAVTDAARARSLGLVIPPAARLSLALGLEGTPIRARDTALGISRLRRPAG